MAEIVSRSSRRDDYGVQLETYAEAGVPTYVIVDPAAGWVHVNERPKGLSYQDVQTYTFGTSFTIIEPSVTIDTSLWPRDDR